MYCIVLIKIDYAPSQTATTPRHPSVRTKVSIIHSQDMERFLSRRQTLRLYFIFHINFNYLELRSYLKTFEKKTNIISLQIPTDSQNISSTEGADCSLFLDIISYALLNH